MSEQLYYIQDSRGFVGNSVIWWRPKGDGYTTDLKDAGTFDADFLRHCRISDIPFKREEIDAIATLHVDMQHLPKPGWNKQAGGER